MSLLLAQLIGHIFFQDNTPILDPGYKSKVAGLFTLIQRQPPPAPVPDPIAHTPRHDRESPHGEARPGIPATDALADSYLAAAEQDDLYPADPVRRARADTNRGHAADTLADTRTAIDHYDRAIRTDPLNVSARVSKADLLAEQGNSQGSIAELEKGLTYLPEDLVLLMQLAARYHYDERQPLSAVPLLEKAAHISPGDMYLKLSLADAYIDAQLPSQAHATLQQITDPALAADIAVRKNRLVGM